MFGKKKHGEEYEEYEPLSPEEGYTPVFPETGETDGDWGPVDETGDEEYGEEYDEGGSSWAADDEDGDEEPEEKPEPRSIFRPETRKPNFLVSVLLNTARVLIVLAALAGAAGLGALAGIAKGYVDTAPELNLVALDSQAQTSFIYDSNGNLITEYKGTENRVLVSLDAMPNASATRLSRWRTPVSIPTAAWI